MAEHRTLRDIWNDNDGEEKEKSSSGRLRRLLPLLLILAVVFGVVLLAAYRDGTGFDVLRRYFSYGRVESAGGDTVYDYDSAQNHRFAILGEKLAVLTESSLTLLEKNGNEVVSESVKMNAPALMQGGGRAVAYDVGGTSLYVLNERGKVGELNAAPEEPFLAANLNDAGWLAVTAEKKHLKGCVTVYDSSMKEIFTFNSSRRFVLDAYVSDDCKFLAAVTLGQENSVFVTNVLIYDLTKTGPAEPVANYSVQDGLVYAIDELDGELVTVSDTDVTFADTRGTIKGTYHYRGEFLREYSLEGDGFATVLLNRYRSGSVGRLVTIDSNGKEIASLDVNEEVQSISARGRYLAVLYLDRLVVYNQDMQVYATLQGTGSAKEVLLRSDGSALLCSSEEAKLFLP